MIIKIKISKIKKDRNNNNFVLNQYYLHNDEVNLAHDTAKQYTMITFPFLNNFLFFLLLFIFFLHFIFLSSFSSFFSS